MPRESFISDAYDPDEIYTGPASSDDGHSSNLRCSIPTEWAGAIADIVNSPEWPEIKSVQSFVRDAIHHRMHWADQQKDRGKIESVRNLQALEAMSATLTRHEEYRMAFDRFLARMEDSLKAALLADDAEVILALLEDMSDSIPKFPEPHRTKLTETLDRWKRRV